MPTILTRGSGTVRRRHQSAPAVVACDRSAVRHHRARHAVAPSASRALDGPVERAVRRGHHHRAVHRLRGLRRRLPARRHRLRPRGGQLPALPPRGRARPDNCIHGEKGCTSCTRACPRFRTWEPEADVHLFGRDREPDEMYGITKDLLLCRASRRHGAPDRPGRRLRVGAAHLGDGATATSTARSPRSSKVTAPVEGQARASPRNKDEILASAGSRYTYSANTLALKRGAREGLLASSPSSAWAARSSAPPMMWHRKVGQGRQAVPLQHRPAVLEDVRRRHLRGAVRRQVRPAARRTW